MALCAKCGREIEAKGVRRRIKTGESTSESRNPTIWASTTTKTQHYSDEWMHPVCAAEHDKLEAIGTLIGLI